MKIFLNVQDIIEHVGSTYYSRGRSYFNSGRVNNLEYESDRHILGEVSGSRAKPYRTTITLGPSGILSSGCSCPIGGECKHVAALALAIVKEQKNDYEISKVTIDKKGESQKSVMPEWFKKLNLLTKEENKSSNRLQILLRYKKINSYYKKEDHELQIRTRVYNTQTKEYLLDSLNWQDGVRSHYYGYGYSQSYSHIKSIPANLPREHFIFFQELTSALRIDYASRQWASIGDDTASFWQVIKRAPSLNISLFSGTKGQNEVSIFQSPLEVTLEIKDIKDGGLKIENKIVLDGQEIQYPTVLIGNPPGMGLILYDVSSSTGFERFSLFGLGQNNIQLLKQISKPLIIPKNEQEIFKKKFIMPLARQFKFENLSESLIMPQKLEPKAVLKISKTKGQAINLELKAKYDDSVVSFANKNELLKVGDQTILRDLPRETDLKENLASLGLEHLDIDNLTDGGVKLDKIEAARFMNEILPIVEASDIETDVSPDVAKYKFDQSSPEIAFEVKENTDTGDWFNLAISIKVGGEEAVFAELFTALVQCDEYFLMPSGRYFKLDNPAFDRLKKLIQESQTLHEGEKDGLKLSRFQIGFWDELEQLGIVKKQAHEWLSLLNGFKKSKGAKLIEVPVKLKANLRHYQQEGYSWLKFLHEFKLGGILADDMGLGKTVQTVALIVSQMEIQKDKKPFLVIAPTSVVENWEQELDHFAPHLKKVIMRRGDRSEHHRLISSSDVIVTSYSLFQRDFDELEKYTFDTLILDEAQFIKNYQTKAYSFVKKLKVQTKIALTGTPMENNLMELWSIFSLVSPGLFPGPKKFQEIYRTPIEKNHDKEMLEKLRQRIRPFILRRKKELVEKELPAKTEQIMYLDLNVEHRHLYDLHLQKERQKVLGLLENGGMKDNRFEILGALTKMRQLCLHPVLVDEKNRSVPATKLVALLETVKELVGDKHRILIFSQFTSLLAEVKTIFDLEKLAYLYLDGSTKDRRELIKDFQTRQTPIFLISLKAGGFGLNLTAADYCILLDPWWNPAVENQAIDRMHRIGQNKPVFVYKLIAKDTIEEKVLALQEKKKKLFQNVLEDGHVFSTLITEKDIKSIFE